MGHGTSLSGSGHCKPSAIFPRIFGGRSNCASRRLSTAARCFKTPMVTETAVIKSPSDKREYQVVHLRNGLAALLIHDPEIRNSPPHVETNHEVASSDGSYYTDDEGESGTEEDDEGGDEDDGEDAEEDDDGKTRRGKKRGIVQTKKAAAAMCVNVGSFSDPKDAEGLAHFLEHMLFMGSVKFPDENEYDGFLAEHGGSSNAFTEMEFTCYHFDVNNLYLKPALERFSQFFVAPLIKADSIEREIQAVDSEFVQALQNDSCRLEQLKCNTASSCHPYNRFAWGNAKSLSEAITKCADIRQKLMGFYRQHYVASRMKLVVLGGEPLETLKEWVIELFEDIPEGSAISPVFSWKGGPVWQAGKLYRVESVKDQHLLSLSWVLPCLDAEYLKKPHDYLSHLIGHEGTGSFLQFLRRKGWATDLSAGVGEDNFERSTAGYMFSVDISLTLSGLDKIHDILGNFFQYIRMLRQTKPQEWVFEEMQAIMGLDFRFAEEEPADDYVAALSKNMHLYPEHHVIYGDYAIEQWDPKLVEELLSYINPKCMRVDLVTKAFDKDASGVILEPWFGVPYTVTDLPESLIDSWANPEAVNSAFHIPPVNEFISRDYSIKVAADSSKQSPIIIEETDSTKVWYKLDQTFKTPRANVYLTITCKLDNLRSEVLAHLYVLLLKDALNETLYMANVGGLSVTMSYALHKINFKVRGYNEKLYVLARKVSELVRSLVAADDRFQVVKEQLERIYRNAKVKPLAHSESLRLHILKKDSWTEEEKLACLSTVSVEDVNGFVQEVFAEAHIEALCHGNLTKDEALDIVSIMRKAVVTTPMPEDSKPKERMVKLPSRTDLAYNVAVVNELEENSVVEMYFQLGMDLGIQTVRDRVLADLFENIVYEPFFNQLRTIEQLGYRVDCGSRYTYGLIGFRFRIMSSNYHPAYIHKRIDGFINEFQGTLKLMSEEVFQNYKACLIAEKLEKDTCLIDETDRHWEHIVDQRYIFDAHEREALDLKDIKKKDLLEWYNSYIRPGGVMRRSLSIHVWGCKLKEEMKKNSRGSKKKKVSYKLIESIEDFKNKAELYPPFP